ncbi:hypothetical protein BH23ACT2_BH23ACT2_30870 [soil metagenome]
MARDPEVASPGSPEPVPPPEAVADRNAGTERSAPHPLRPHELWHAHDGVGAGAHPRTEERVAGLDLVDHTGAGPHGDEAAPRFRFARLGPIGDLTPRGPAEPTERPSAADVFFGPSERGDDAGSGSSALGAIKAAIDPPPAAPRPVTPAVAVPLAVTADGTVPVDGVLRIALDGIARARRTSEGQVAVELTSGWCWSAAAEPVTVAHPPASWRCRPPPPPSAPWSPTGAAT